MASTTSDVRSLRPPAGAAPGRRRPPATVLAAAGVAAVEAVGLAAVGLTGLDGLLTAPGRPSAAVVVGVLLGLATWVVLCAGGGLVLLDASGGSLLTAVAYAEAALVGAALVLGLATTLLDGLPVGLPLPALALLCLAVPVGKLLLAGAPSALAWSAAGPRRPAPRTELGRSRRTLRVATVAAIGLALVTVALSTPAEGPTDAGFPAPVGQH